MLKIHVTTTSNESQFLGLEWTRTETERLSSLILIVSEKEFVKSHDLEVLMDKFAKIHRRRYHHLKI